MITRQLSVTEIAPPRDLTLHAPRYWRAVIVFTCLGGLHLSIAIPAFYHGRWEAFLSAAFGTIFVLVALACAMTSSEMTIEQRHRRIRLRTGYRRLRIERFIPFQNVHGVRLTMLPGRSTASSRIELLCDNEDLECPPTDIPRQEALCLAVAMNVRLIKVYSDDLPPVAERLDSLPTDRR